VLVEEGKARIDAKDAQGSTPLLVAVVCDQGNIALYLASKGADVEVSRGPFWGGQCTGHVCCV
jgi:ankyrin repeat protein